MDDEIRAAANRLLKLCLDKGQKALILRADDEALWVHCQDEADLHWMCKAVVDAHEAPNDRSVN